MQAGKTHAQATADMPQTNVEWQSRCVSAIQVRLMSRCWVWPIMQGGCNQWRQDFSNRTSSSFTPPQPRRQRTPTRPRSLNCTSTARYCAHDARPSRSCRADTERRHSPSPPCSICSYTPFGRRHPVATSAENPRYGERCPEAHIWRLEGPGPHLPEPLRPPWCGPEERHEIRRLAQDKGDHTQGPRLGA